MQLDGVDVKQLEEKYPGSDITAVKVRIGCEDDDDCDEKVVTLPDGLQLPIINGTIPVGNVTEIELDGPCIDDVDCDKVSIAPMQSRKTIF